MKLFVLVEVDVSPTLAETMQRTGFNICRDGSAMQIKIPNSPAIPQRKLKVAFVKNPGDDVETLLRQSLTNSARA